MRIIRIFFFILIILSFTNCIKTWNDKFVKGEIDINKEIPIGTDYNTFMNYLNENKVKKIELNIGYTDKILKKNYPFSLNDDIWQEIDYCIEVHGHKDFIKFSGYFHPIYYFCFNKDNKLIYIGEHGYP